MVEFTVMTGGEGYTWLDTVGTYRGPSTRSTVESEPESFSAVIAGGDELFRGLVEEALAPGP